MKPTKPVWWLLTLALGLALAAGARPARASEQVIFGPATYTRTAGPPNQFTDSFALPTTLIAPFRLHVQNGDTGGGHRVSSATIKLNGTQVAGPSDFSQQVAGFDKTVSLQTSNTLEVRLTSAPGSFLVVTVFATVPPPTLTSLLPPSLPITQGQTGTLTATITLAQPAAATIALSSDTPAVATVPASATVPANQTTVAITVTGVAPGTATITATLNATTAHSTVTVTPAGPTVTSLLPLTLQVTQGASGTLTVAISAAQATDTVVSLTTSDGAIVGLPPAGTLTVPAGLVSEPFAVFGVAPGTATITATLNGTSAHTQVTVVIPLPTVVSLLPPVLPLTEGSSGTLTVTLNATQPTDTDVALTTSDPAIVGLPPGNKVTVPAHSLSAAFPVTGLKRGLATVTASVAGTTATAAIEVLPPPPTVQALTCPATLTAGATSLCAVTLNATQLMATAVPLASDASGVASVPPSVTVPASALTAQAAVTAVAVGSATITAGPLHGTSQTANVQVLPPPPTIVSLLPASPTIFVGATASLTLTLNAAQLADTPVPLSSSAPSVASTPAAVVVPAGSLSVAVVITGESAGPATITAGPLNGTQPQSTITVNQLAPTATALTPALSLPKGLAGTLTVTIAPTQPNPTVVPLASSDATTVGVPPTVTVPAGASTAAFPVLANNIGSATITAGPLNGTSQTATVTITPPELVSLALTPIAPSIPKGTTQAFAATGTFTDTSTQDETGSATWTSSDAAVATITSPGGVATGVGQGSAQITAGLGAIVSPPATLTVTPPVLTGLTVSPTNPTRNVGDTVQFHATGILTDASTQDLTTAVTWSGSNTTVATIGATTGLATALARGTTTITAAHAASGLSASTALTVNLPPPTIAITSPASGFLTNQTSVTVTGTVTSPALASVAVNGVLAAVTGNSFQAAGVPLPAEDANPLTATATDAAGQTATASVTVTRDTTPPSVSITSPAPRALTNQTSVTVTGTATDANGLAGVTVNGVSATLGSGTFTAANVPLAAEGANALTAAAVDRAGNTATASVTVVRDTAPPTVILTKPVAGAATNQTSLAVEGRVADAGGVASVAVNGVGAVLTAGAFTAPAVPLPVEGPNTLAVTAADQLGNSATTTVPVLRDTVPPSLQMVSPTPGAVLGGTVPVELTADDGAGSGIANLTVTSPAGLQDTEPPANLFRAVWDTRTVPDGPFTVVAEARDSAGNVTTVSVDVVIANAGRFEAAPSLPAPRTEHTSTLLNDGTAYLFGGRDAAGGLLDSGLRFDPGTGQYTPVPLTPAPLPRRGHAAAVLPLGNVLMVGGAGAAGVLVSAELHDPGAGTVTPLPAGLLTPRRGHSATLLMSGDVLIVGGEDAAGNPLTSAEVFDSRTGTLRTHPAALTVARSGQTATLLPDGRILLLGGRTLGGALLDTAEVFDPTTNAFSPLPDLRLPEGRADHSATLLPTGEVLVAGGRTAAGPVASTLIVSIPSLTVRPFISLAGPRASHTATLLPGGRLLLAGGEASAILESAEQFVPTAADTISPAVADVQPASGATGIGSDTRIAVRFTEPIDPRTLTPTAFTLTGPSGAVGGTLSAGENGLLAFLTPASPLAPGARHAVALTSDVHDMAGNPLAPTTLLFTTRAVAPGVTAIVPATIPQGSTASLTISGQNLSGATGLSLLQDGAPDAELTATIAASAPTTLTATVAASAGAPLGPRTLVVTAPQGESPREATPFNTLSVIPAPAAGPVIVAFDPPSGPEGSVLTIQGRGFGATPAENAVTFAGTTQLRIPAAVDAASPARLTVRVPTGAISGPVTVQVGALTSNPFLFVVGGTRPAIVGTVGSILVGGGPAAIAVHQALGLAVVAKPEAGSVALLDLGTRGLLGEVAIGGKPAGVAVFQDLGQALVGNTASRDLARLDLGARSLLDRIPLVGFATDVATLEAPPLAYAAEAAANTVQVIDGTSGFVFPSSIPGAFPAGVAVEPTGVWVANRDGGTLSGFFPLPLSFFPLGTVPLPSPPEKVAVHSLRRLAVVTLPQVNQAALVDLAGLRVVATLPVGTNPKGVAVSQDSSLAVVANLGDNSASIVDLAARAVIATVPVGQGPTGVAIHEASQLAVVTNATDGTLTFIDLHPLPPGPVEVAGFGPASGPVGTLVTIQGTGFDGSPSGSTVTFSSPLGRLIAPLISASTTQIVAQVPDGATTGPVGVTTRAGAALSRSNFLVTGNPLRVRITSPADGAAIAADRVDVAGVIDLSTATVGVSVNSVPAQVSGNAFLARNVPLQFAGPTALTATAVDELGTRATTTITVQGTAEPPAATLTAAPSAGEAPLTVTLTLEVAPTTAIRTFELDFEGDGIVDRTLQGQFPPVPFTYPREGAFHPTVTMTDVSGRRFTAAAVVSVTSVAFLVQKWNDMKAALVRGDLEGALLFFTEPQRDRYRALFSALSGQIAQIARDMQDIQFIYLQESRAKFRIRRPQLYGGQQVTFTYYIYFVQDGAGLWSIEGF